jgi:hypothetical protein
MLSQILVESLLLYGRLLFLYSVRYVAKLTECWNRIGIIIVGNSGAANRHELDGTGV